MKSDMESITDWNNIQESFFDLFSQQYGLYDLVHESAASRESAGQFINFLQLKPGATVVELGCGRGEWLRRLAKLGHRVTGIDISQKSLDLLSHISDKNHLTEKIELFKGDVQDDLTEKLGGRQFELVFGYNLLHHVLDIEKTIENMILLTKPGGRVVIYEPNPFHFWWYLCPLFDPKFKWPIERGLLNTSPLKIQNIFKSKGLRNITLYSADYFPFISPDRTFHLTSWLNRFFGKLPVLKYLPAVYYLGGEKR